MIVCLYSEVCLHIAPLPWRYDPNRFTADLGLLLPQDVKQSLLLPQSQDVYCTFFYLWLRVSEANEVLIISHI